MVARQKPLRGSENSSLYAGNYKSRGMNYSGGINGPKASNKGSGQSLGASTTLNNSQIHGRKIDSPKIHVKEVADNRPKTSAQQIRKYTLNESQQLSNLGGTTRIPSKRKKKER
jgi:hypothetical protein